MYLPDSFGSVVWACWPTPNGDLEAVKLLQRLNLFDFPDEDDSMFVIIPGLFMEVFSALYLPPPLLHSDGVDLEATKDLALSMFFIASDWVRLWAVWCATARDAGEKLSKEAAEAEAGAGTGSWHSGLSIRPTFRGCAPRRRRLFRRREKIYFFSCCAVGASSSGRQATVSTFYDKIMHIP